MVCASTESPVEHRVQCIVYYADGDQQKHEETLPSSTPVNELVKSVAKKMKLNSSTIQLRLQLKDGDTLFNENDVEPLGKAGFKTETGSRNLLHVEMMKKRRERTFKRNEIETKPLWNRSQIQPPPALLPPVASPAAEYNLPSPVARQDTGYVGLVNQAMTCYLNSLLQALYMTPEFRNALYKWKFDESHGKSPAKCIPLQLQKIFLNLQTSTKTAVETTDLTKSFGWESGEVWQQHDIQELCRVMFDALEHEFKDTEQRDLINRLYQGTMIDYVKCLECGKVKNREDTFLDIPLPVKPFNCQEAYHSIEEALKGFVQPEVLDDTNQYFCESCNKKCDAHKGLKFTKFPYLLTLHLKRFDFDYNTLHRMKLNDKVTFKQILDLNHFIDTNDPEKTEMSGDGVDLIKVEDSSVSDAVKVEDSSASDSALGEDSNHTNETKNTDSWGWTGSEQEDDEGIDVNGTQEYDKPEMVDLSNGPFVYELYSIMIHSGSASGGHYYAYIKDFAKNQWYSFNDQTVTSITQDDISKTYGGGQSRAYYSGAYSTNAYMLMYRQIDKSKNCLAMTEAEFPPHIIETLELIKKQEEEERLMRARQEEMVRINVYTSESEKPERFICHYENTMEQLLELVCENRSKSHQYRLVSYNKERDKLMQSFEGRENDQIRDVLRSLKSTRDLYLEKGEPSIPFTPYNVGDIFLKVFLVNPVRYEVESSLHIRTSPCQEMKDLKKVLARDLDLENEDFAVILGKSSEMQILDDTVEQPLNRLGFSHDLNTIFVVPIEDLHRFEDAFQTSELCDRLKKLGDLITVKLICPDDIEGTIESLLIPPLDSEEKMEIKNPDDTNGLTVTINEDVFGSAGATSDQSASEDSSLTDSERTIVGDRDDAACDLSSGSDSERPPPPPMDQLYEMLGNTAAPSIKSKERYFRVTPFEIENDKKAFRAFVDRTMSMDMFLKNVEKLVGVSSKYIQVLQGTSEVRTLDQCRDNEKFTISFQRDPSEGEQKVKIFYFNPRSTAINQSSDHFRDWLLCCGKPVGETKKQLLKEIRKRRDMADITLERVRLRKKLWHSPGRILSDNELWGDHILHGPNQGFEVSSSIDELFVQILDSPEEVTSDTRAVFARRWYPCTTKFGHFDDVVLTCSTIEEFKKKLSELSLIPAENIKIYKSTGAYPFDKYNSLLNSDDSDWEVDDSCISEWIKNSTDDNLVIVYKDSTETRKVLSAVEMDRVLRSNSESSSKLPSPTHHYSSRKERGLKIAYHENTRPNQKSTIDVD